MIEIELPFTTISIHDGYAIGRTNANVEITMERHQQAMEAIQQHLPTPFGLILDEVNSYSISFPVLRYVRDSSDICCIGVIYHRWSTRLALNIGAEMIDKPFYFAKDQAGVVEWIRQQGCGR